MFGAGSSGGAGLRKRWSEESQQSQTDDVCPLRAEKRLFPYGSRMSGRGRTRSDNELPLSTGHALDHRLPNTGPALDPARFLSRVRTLSLIGTLDF
jgi:hypothetical protein